MPIPANYVLDENNEIIYTSVNPNWMDSAEMKEDLEMLKQSLDHTG